MSATTRRSIGLCALATAALGLGACSAPEAPSAERPAETDAGKDAPAPPAEAMPVTEAEPADDQAEGASSLDDYRRELAANEAKLRSLGVEVGAADGEASPEEAVEEERKKTEAKPTPSKPAAQPGGSAAGLAGGPGRAPSTKGEISGGGSKTAKKERSSRPKQDRKKNKDKGRTLGGADLDDAARDEAKAVQAPPDANQPDGAVNRCESICDLGVSTCELREHICELAERHPGEEDYAAACERAVDDCEVAQEACDACAE